MGKIRLLILIVLMFSVQSGICFALEWQVLHEISRKLTLDDALDNVSERPGSLEEQYVLGLVYLNKHDYVSAGATFEKVLDKDPSMFEAKWGIAEAMRCMHEYKESSVILDEIIKGHPDFAPAYNSLGYIKYINMSFSESADLIAKVLNMESDKVDPYTLLSAHGIYAAAKGMMAQYGGPFAKSVNFFAVKKHLKIAKDLDPDSLVVYFGYGSFYMSIPSILGRDLEKAEEYLLKATEIDPLFSDTYVRLAQIYRKKGDLDNYEKFLKTALELDPKNELALDMINGTCRFICLDEEEGK